jgi:hypothetical protein
LLVVLEANIDISTLLNVTKNPALLRFCQKKMNLLSVNLALFRSLAIRLSIPNLREVLPPKFDTPIPLLFLLLR